MLEAIALSPGRLVALSYGTYCQHARRLEPHAKPGWFTVIEPISLAAGAALGLCALPEPALAERLGAWFPQGEDAHGSCQGAGVYVAIEPTLLPVGLQVALTAEKAAAWQFYVKAVAPFTFEVRRPLPFSPGECIRCSTLPDLPQQWMQVCASDLSAVCKEKVVRADWLACQLYYVKQSTELPAGRILHLSARQANDYSYLEVLKEGWYRTDRHLTLGSGEWIGLNQGLPEEGLVFAAPPDNSQEATKEEGQTLAELVKAKGPLSLSNLQAHLPDLHRRTLLRQLDVLIAAGQVLRQGRGRATAYVYQAEPET